MSDETRDVAKLLSDGVTVLAALRDGAREALRVHRISNLPLAIWRDGKVAWVSPDEFERLLDNPPRA